MLARSRRTQASIAREAMPEDAANEELVRDFATDWAQRTVLVRDYPPCRQIKRAISRSNSSRGTVTRFKQSE